MVFDDGNIAALHKLFAFDATLIFDIIKLVPVLSIDDKSVVAKYCTEFAQRKYEIIIVLPHKECEGENETMRQNKILLRQVATLTDRITMLETQINKLAKQPDQIVANRMFINSQWNDRPEEFYYWQPYVDFENIEVVEHVVSWYGPPTDHLLQHDRLDELSKYMSDVVLAIKKSINISINNIGGFVGWFVLYKILDKATPKRCTNIPPTKCHKICLDVVVSVCKVLHDNNFDIGLKCAWRTKTITIAEWLTDIINGGYSEDKIDATEKGRYAKIALDILKK
jgi:hypothetical protein